MWASALVSVLLSLTFAAAPLAAQDANAGVSTSPGAAHTSSATITRSGTASSASGTPDGATEPVVDPITQPAARTTSAQPQPAREEPAPQEEGDGRDIDFLWLEAQGGISYANLIQFQNQNFADIAGGASVFNEVYGTGAALGVGAGFRIWWLAVGARASFAFYDTFQIGTIGGELTLRLPVPVVEPWIRVGFGYGWQGEANYQGGVAAAQTTTYGWVFQGGLGLDIYLLRWLTLGAGLGLDVLNLTRQRDPAVSCMGVTDVCPGQNGDALGLQIKGLLTLGLRF